MGAAVLLAGALGAAVIVFSFVKDVAGPLARFTTDRPVELDLPAESEHTIYRKEGQSVYSPSVSCQVTELATGRPIPTTPNEGFSRQHDDEALVSLTRFRAGSSGRYRVSCSTERSRPVGLAVGPRVRLFAGIARVFGAGAVGLVALCVAVAIVASTAVKRHEHFRRSRTS